MKPRSVLAIDEIQLSDPAFWARPYGDATGFNDDHLHLDLGFTTVVPRTAPGE